MSDFASAMALLRLLNYQDLQGLCRCVWFDNKVACQFSPCHFFHQGQDCIEFTATGQCEKGAACTLQHVQIKHDYCKRMPLRPDISPEVRAVWADVQQRAASDAISTDDVFSQEEQQAWLADIVKADAQLKITLEQMSAIRAMVQRRGGVGALQQLERLFRKRKMNTWLLARRVSSDAVPANYNFACLFEDGSSAPYHLFISMRYPDAAIGELLLESSTYAENFDKLQQTGFLTITK